MREWCRCGGSRVFSLHRLAADSADRREIGIRRVLTEDYTGRMNSRFLQVCVALGLLTFTLVAPSTAHHSLSNYEYDRRVTLEGKVTEFRFVNPHPLLMVEVDGRTWTLEMDNRFELVTIGITDTTFRSGERVKVSGSPARDGGAVMYLRRLERPADGLVYEQRGSSPFISHLAPQMR